MQGINPDRYAVFDVVKLPRRRTAYLQRALKASEPLQFCAYIAGNGHYFRTLTEMQEYIRCRRLKR